jgi:CRISPR-associated endonuclease Cas3-HD
MLANTQGQRLFEHNKAVANIAKAMALKLGLTDELTNKIYTASMLHDIGKVVPRIQQHLVLCTNPSALLIVDEDFQEPISTQEIYPLHHEISWAFLTQKISDKYILNAIYWHHARPIHTDEHNKKATFDTADDVMGALDSVDIDALERIWNELLPLIAINKVPLTGTVEVPDLFEKDGNQNRNDNAEFMLIRACVISADRHVSALCPSAVDVLSVDTSKAMDEVNNLLIGDIQGSPVKPPDYEQDRYNLQADIIESVGDSKTTIVKGPAGLGKTLIGVLWARAQKEKILWVCPRNTVADTVYKNIIQEVEALGLFCSVELYRTGKRQSTNREDNRPEFSSDIVVTNIDAIMNPMVNNGVAGRLFTIFGCSVILDEFHEFVSDAPMFAAFVTYMRARHRVASTCKTLLLSATPSMIQFLWDVPGSKDTLVLPSKKTHYPAAHKGVYQVCFATDFPANPIPGSLLVCNSITEAQNNFGLGYTHILHHRYTDTDRKRIEKNIFSSFGKNKVGVINGESVSAAMVVQAAMDISFSSLYDSVCSPESSLQRIGRTDRWGTFQKYNPTITFMSINERTERGAVRTVYDEDLKILWINFLKQKLIGITSIDLSHLYEIYNEFYRVYEVKVKKFLLELYRVGMNGPHKGMEFLGLVGFIPIKVLNTVPVDPNNKKKVVSKNLRSPNGSYFYTVELDNQPNVWLPPDNVLSEGSELYDRYMSDGNLNAGLLASGPMLTRLKGLVQCGYVSWTKQSKGKLGIPGSLKDWFKKARNSETPLPDFSRKYNSQLGVIKI